MLLHLLAESRRAADIEYTVALLQQGPLAEEVRALGYPVRVFEAGRLRQVFRYMRTVAQLYAWIRRERADLVLSWMSKAHLYAGPAALAAGVGAVWYQHGIARPTRMEKALSLVPAKAVILPSNAALAEQTKMTPKLPAAVIYPSVDLRRFNPVVLPPPEEVRRELGLPQDKRIIGIVARLQRWKGVHVFLEAAVKISRAVPDTYFVVVGGKHQTEPEYPEALRRQAERAGLSGRVLFAGEQRDTARWMQSFDILVHASMREPFGMVIVEGMALGKPVVAAKAGGPTESVVHGENGLLVPPGDAEALAAAVIGLLADEEKRARISRAARERARQYSAERMAREMAQFLHLNRKAGT